MARASCGRFYPCSQNSLAICEEAGKEGYDFVATYMAHPWCCFNPDNVPDELPPIIRPDLIETCGVYTSLFVAKISPWIDVDSNDVRLRRLSEKALNAELSYYTYLNVAAIIIEISNGRNTNLAKIISQYLTGPKTIVIWISVPLNAESCKDAKENDDPWYWFYKFRTACDNKDRLGVALKLSSNIPENADTPEILRWYGEPLRAIVVDTKLFSSTAKTGSPILDGVYETMIKSFFLLNVQILITGEQLHEKVSTNENFKSISPSHCAYFTYCNYLYRVSLQNEVGRKSVMSRF